MKKLMFVSLIALVGLHLLAQDCSDLIISEYSEGSQQNKVLEFYNTTDKIINLGDYLVARYSNGQFNYDGGGITRLVGFLQPYSTYLLVNGTKVDAGFGVCDPALHAIANQLDHDYPSPTSMNGNDAIALFYDPVGVDPPDPANLVVVDLFGIIGGGMTEPDEGWASFTDTWVYKNNYQDSVLVGRDSAYITHYIVPEGYYWLPWSSGHSLVRKPGVKKGVTANPATEFVITAEWDTVPGGINQWDSLGSHYCECEHATALELSQFSADLSVYPNPVNKNVFVKASDPMKELILLDASARVIFRQQLEAERREHMVSVPETAKGVYFLKVKFQEGILTRKIVIN